VIDDRQHDHIVWATGNKHAQGVVELGGIELLTGYYFYGLKPIFEKEGDTLEKMGEVYTRYIAACGIWRRHKDAICITKHEFARYVGDRSKVTAIEIECPIEYCFQKPLSRYGIRTPPQSYVYAKNEASND
jgi:hypothetical protein